MEQHFKIANLDTFERIEPDSFILLMEFCYIGNSAPDEAMRLLLPGNQWHNTRIIFVGDYCDGDGKEKSLRQSTIKKLPLEFKHHAKNALNLYEIFKNMPEKDKYGGEVPRYLFNHSRKHFTDLNDCREYNGSRRIHPLGLLTALGNGNGEGDYYGVSGSEYVGSWCGDTLSSDFELTYTEYGKITPNFME